MIKFKSKGDFSKTTRWFEQIIDSTESINLDKYGKAGVSALASATPKDSGETANSWSYEIKIQNGKSTISFTNSNINEGVPIAIILQYGHATRNGGWVEGIDYINPAIRPIFEKLVNDAWEEVTKA